MKTVRDWSIPQVVPEYGGDYSEPLWKEENSTTYCDRVLNQKYKITLNEVENKE